MDLKILGIKNGSRNHEKWETGVAVVKNSDDKIVAFVANCE
jgi:hypothetical protein